MRRPFLLVALGTVLVIAAVALFYNPFWRLGAGRDEAKSVRLQFDRSTAINNTELEVSSVRLDPVAGKIMLVTVTATNTSELPVRSFKLNVNGFYCLSTASGVANCVPLGTAIAHFDSDGVLIPSGGRRTLRTNVYFEEKPVRLPRYLRDPKLHYSYTLASVETTVGAD